MRLCVIGNSHVGALRTAWVTDLAAQHPDIQLTFFAQRGGAIANLEIRDGCFVPAHALQKRAIEFTSGGLSRIDPAAYDAFLIYGLHAHDQSGGRVFYSGAVRRAAAKDSVLGQANHRLMTRLRGLTDKPVFVGLDPLPALDPEALQPAEIPYAQALAEIAEACYAPHDAVLLPQPAETVLQGCATRPAFSKGSERLAIGDENTDGLRHGAEEILHMNADYGRLWLDAFLPHLQPVPRRV